jgi:hypothetical protein
MQLSSIIANPAYSYYNAKTFRRWFEESGFDHFNQFTLYGRNQRNV